ncbi:hypothetical protein D3C85_1382750 [compost metagenome]
MPPLPSGHSGAATTGQPAKEMGCVSRPMAGRQGWALPLISIHSLPMAGALTGVAGAMSTSQSWNSALTLSRYARRKRCARRYQSAGCSRPDRKRSTDSGSKSCGRWRRFCRCRLPPSLAVTMKAAARASAASGHRTSSRAPSVRAARSTAARAGALANSRK